MELIQKTSFIFFCACLEFRLNFEDFEEKDDSCSWYISEVRDFEGRG